MSTEAGRARAVGVAMFALIVVAIFFDPAFLTPAPVFGVGVDPGGTLWMYDWVKNEVLSGNFPAHTTRMYYPEGVDLMARNGSNVVDAIISIPFQLAFGPQRGMMITAVLIILGNGFSFLPLARYLAPQRPYLHWGVAGWWMSNGYVLQELQGGRPTQAMLWFVPPAVLALVRFRDSRDAILLGIWTGLAALVYWYSAPFLALALAPLGLARLVRDGLEGVKKLAIALLISVMVASPLAAPIVYSLTMGNVPGLAEPVGEAMLYVDAAHRFGNLFERSDDLTTVLAVVLAMGTLRRAWILLGTMIGIWFSLGLRFGTSDMLIDNVPYIWLYEHSSFITRLNFPERIWSVVNCLLACSFLFTFARTRSRWLPILLVLTGLSERRSDRTLPLSPFDASEMPASVIVRTHPGPILTVPVQSVDSVLMQQMYHRQPMVGGMGDHEPRIRTTEYSARIASNPFFAALVANSDDGASPWTRADVDALKQWVRWIWFDSELQMRTNGFDTARTTAMRLEAYLGKPYYSDQYSSVWDLRRPGAEATEEEQEFASAVLGVRSDRERLFPRPTSDQEQVLEDEAAFGAGLSDKEKDDEDEEAAPGGTPSMKEDH
ncbi:MAG: hypothetical protein FJ090_11245 [Deltaproteobacteria bacterium]|nr:hypothetical protein [Deltaproteobacteria bacterium]